MNCPKCSDSTLTEKKVKGMDVILDLCPGCKGFWFDTNELGAVLQVPVQEVKVPQEAQEQKHLCPKCQIPLFAFCYPQTMVIIDSCKGCGGIWLDNSEFQEIRNVRKSLKNVKEKTKKIVCPKCGNEQAPTEECTKCGIVFSKYQQTKKGSKIPQNRPKVQESDMPEGAKGKILHTVNSTIDSLLNKF